MGLTSNHTHTDGKGGTCHGFLAIDPAVFGDAAAIKEHLSVFLKELRESPKKEGETRIYTHGEKEVFAEKDRRENGIAVNINTVAEMFDMSRYVGLDPVKYLGDVKFDDARELKICYIKKPAETKNVSAGFLSVICSNCQHSCLSLSG